MSEKSTHTMEYDETIPTHDRDGVVEHKHAGFEYWHPVSRRHDGCGRTDSGVDSDVRMCAFCEYTDDISMCHTRRRQLGLRKASVAHGVPRMVTHVGIDAVDTLMMIDEAVVGLICAKSAIARVGVDSDHVQQARFEQFIKSVDGIVLDLLKESFRVGQEMEDDRNVNVHDM